MNEDQDVTITQENQLDYLFGVFILIKCCTTALDRKN